MVQFDENNFALPEDGKADIYENDGVLLTIKNWKNGTRYYVIVQYNTGHSIKRVDVGSFNLSEGTEIKMKDIPLQVAHIWKYIYMNLLP